MIACLFIASDRVPRTLISSPEICKISLQTSESRFYLSWFAENLELVDDLEEDCDLPEILISFSGLGYGGLFIFFK